MINIYLFFSVKPAVFDLFLAAGIVAYLGVVYLVVQVCFNLLSFSSFTLNIPDFITEVSCTLNLISMVLLSLIVWSICFTI